ncbi:hypothetical protein P608_07365 [Comamonas thiooxydans]|uniref:Uncharacterized protein n=1 Tax=Comamonas thiooxydans TaxID=363952 RepID=A0A096GI83_9BURK|nr:hypothetical protein P369_24650 [Comamonas thiooxydans]KGG92981.1 hypothetical protein P367_23990 [Comamonas thiooxydans]KGH03434.1 hypothetical protein P368_24915 [Comamonas thiooxydans]KGH08542.1 hypothetical protein P365_03195 [Comamonas thiooxydans]KGH15640.1 hypothetical protein P608_07365 [Comamonas thiooxydans]
MQQDARSRFFASGGFEPVNEALQRSRSIQFCRNVIGLRHNA